jgi:hypothetical protein
MQYLGQNFIFSLVIGCYLQMSSLFLSCLDSPIARAERLTVRASKMLHWLYFLGDFIIFRYLNTPCKLCTCLIDNFVSCNKLATVEMVLYSPKFGLYVG